MTRQTNQACEKPNRTKVPCSTPDRSALTHTQRDKALFDHISTSYAAKDQNPPARVARAYRLWETVREMEPTPEDRILEVGCGAGFSADYLDGRFKQYLGIDYSDALIEKARARWSHATSKVEFRSVDIRDFRCTDLFDRIFMIGVLHHIESPEEVLRNLLPMLKPGAPILCNEPSRSNPIIQLLRRCRTKIDPAYSDDQAVYRPKELTRLFAQAGFVNIHIRPQGFFSTPFAEVPSRPVRVFSILARMSCFFDRMLARNAPMVLRPLAWNLVVRAHRPNN